MTIVLTVAAIAGLMFVSVASMTFEEAKHTDGAKSDKHKRASIIWFVFWLIEILLIVGVALS